MFNFNSTEYVKIKASEWNDLKKQAAKDKEIIDNLKANQAPELQNTIKKLKEEIKALKRYKEIDDTIFEWEQANQQKIEQIKELKDELESFKKENKTLTEKLNSEKNMVTLLMQYIQKNLDKKCPDYKTVSKFEIYG